MKKTLLAVVLAAAPAFAFAGTCASPGGPITVGSDTTPQITGNSCTDGESASFGGGICSGALPFDPSTPVALYTVTVGATNSFNIVVEDTAPFNAAIALLNPGACGATAPCYGGANDANAAGGGETLPDGGGDFPNNIPAGNYLAAVFSTDSAPANCGAFTLRVSNVLPVQLQSFTVG